MNQVAKIEPQLDGNRPASTVLTPMEMLDHALRSGATPEVLGKFMDLQERWQAAQSRQAFTEAFSAFKAEAVAVIRNKKITDGPLKGKSYAELSSFVEAVTPALSKHGLNASWSVTRDDKDWIEVTCTIEHVMGHSKCVAMGGPPDTGGAKNAIQARMSTVTYLERHTLKAACGISERGDDSDGKSSAAPSSAITAEEASALRDMLKAAGAPANKFLKWAKVNTIEDIPSAYYDSCVDAIKSFKKVAP